MTPGKSTSRLLLILLLPAAAVLVTTAVAPPGTLPTWNDLGSWARGRPTLATLAGRIRFDGQFVSMALLELHDDEGPIAGAMTKPDGLFLLANIPPGTYRITIRSLPENDAIARPLRPVEEGPVFAPEPFEPMPLATIPQRYHHPDTSGLQVTLTPGMQQLEIELLP